MKRFITSKGCPDNFRKSSSSSLCAVVYLLAKPVTILGGMEAKAPSSACRWCIYYHHQTDFVGAFLYSRLRHARNRRCEIFHDYLLRQHVAVPGKPMHLFMPLL